MITIRCQECGSPKQTHRPGVKFCSRLCQDRNKKRKGRRAAGIYNLLIEWRVTRGGKKGALADIAHEVDRWIRLDKVRRG